MAAKGESALEWIQEAEYEEMNCTAIGVDELLKRRDFPCCVSLVSDDYNVTGCPRKFVALGSRVERIALLRDSNAGATKRVSETEDGKFEERHCVLVGDLRLGRVVFGGVAQVANLQQQLRPQYVRAVDFWVGDDADGVTDSIGKDDVFRVTSIQGGHKTTGQKYVEWQRLRLPLQGAIGIDLQSVTCEPTRLPMSANCKFSTSLSPEQQTLSQLAALSCAGKLQLPLDIAPATSLAMDSSREDHCQLVGFKSVTWLIVYSISSMYTKPGLYRISENSHTPMEVTPREARQVDEAIAFLLTRASLAAMTDIGSLLGAPFPGHDLPQGRGGSTVVSPPVCIDPEDDYGEPPPRPPQKIPLSATPPEGYSSGDEGYSQTYQFLADRRAAAKATLPNPPDSDSDTETHWNPKKTFDDDRLPLPRPFLTLGRTTPQKTPGDSKRYGTLPLNRSDQKEMWTPRKHALPGTTACTSPPASPRQLVSPSDSKPHRRAESPRLPIYPPAQHLAPRTEPASRPAPKSPTAAPPGNWPAAKFASCFAESSSAPNSPISSPAGKRPVARHAISRGESMPSPIDPTTGKWPVNQSPVPHAASIDGIELRQEPVQLLAGQRRWPESPPVPARRHHADEDAPQRDSGPGVHLPARMSPRQPPPTTVATSGHSSPSVDVRAPGLSCAREGRTGLPDGGVQGYVSLNPSSPPSRPPHVSQRGDEKQRQVAQHPDQYGDRNTLASFGHLEQLHRYQHQQQQQQQHHRHQQRQDQNERRHQHQDHQQQRQARQPNTIGGANYEDCEDLLQESINCIGLTLRRNGLGCYENIFRTHRVNSTKFSELTNSSLIEEFDINDASDRIKILQLQSQNNDDY